MNENIVILWQSGGDAESRENHLFFMGKKRENTGWINIDNRVKKHHYIAIAIIFKKIIGKI